ncbi:carbohydrate binding family 9 domain-containing protein [Spirosoma sp. KCTC 42546]|uniref:carbohydrate binding family 9 domain-containing protein n=1 Tax=Spirosoma sp. KCTC 42546 TaxID=2520506 RepID=UPI001158629C|nr:carbohydrate binding family 9 domain-containing protein [Spirosoma sp. KCTC 42546]QDK77450.1 carbohydrate binding family 9 domain-containing protein [Spirosoma sp. KCTC 42546]
MLPLLVRYCLLLAVLPFYSFAQTNLTVPNTAQSDVVRPDTTREDPVLQEQIITSQSVIFTPSKKRRVIQAVEISDKLKIDGRLDELDWQRAKPISRFVQVDPKQGMAANFDTDIRVLFNRHFLYIAATNYDSLGRKGIRTPNFKRDFSAMAHDQFGVVIDGFNDQRNAMTFATNPYGTQRDLLSFDDLLNDIDWDGFWKVRTSRTDSGWIAEMQIPWQTLRYVRSADSTQSWGINFFRRRRYSNELSAWSPYPRAFTSSRVAYAGLITGLKPPPPSPNIRIQPFVLVSDDRYNGTEVGYGQKATLKLGGDAKWAINPNTVLDLTLNTDFAQADVDRQVNNLTRFSVLFPERRAFFLENASLFGVGLPGNKDTGEGGSMVIQPFFSRTIGLATLPDGTSTPVPIDAGARLVYRSLNRNYGGMLVRQRGIPGSPTTDFFVGRYSENVGRQNRIGGLVTLKNVHAIDSLGSRQNGTIALDGFFRLNQTLAYSAMVMGTFDSKGSDQGASAYSQLFYRTNQIVAWWTQSVVTRNFNPAMGFVARTDVIATTPGVYLVNRSKWLPKWVRNFEPGAFLELYHKASTGYLQEANYNFNPIWLTFQNGGSLGLFVNPTFQRLDDGDYRPLGLPIASGKYRYTRYQLMFSSDPSKKVSFQLNGETGRYYDGTLNYARGSMVLAPIPHMAFTVSGELNDFRNVGQYTGTIGLYSVESRMAVNPRLQLISFFQRNTFTDKNIWNIRLAWEFQPLSFLYIVYNNGTYAGSIRATDRQQEQHTIGKLSYLKQF